VFATANLAGFLISMAFLGVVTFLPLYMQLGMGVDATTSGLAILPLMGGLIVSSTIAGQLVSRIGRYKPLMITGAVLLMAGVWLLSRVSVHTTLPDLCWRMAIVGLGLGPGQSLFGLAAQNAVEPRDIGVATSSNQFFRQIGSTIGVALFGALLTHRLASLGQGADLGALQGMALKATASGAHHAADPTLSLALTHAITGVFLAGLAVIGAGLVVILFIPELPLRSRQPAGAPVLEKDPV
jgi:MFS family permease